MSGIVAAGLTVLVALFLTPLFEQLPEATLAAIVLVAIARLFKWRELLRLYRLRRLDFALALITFLGVLTFDEALYALLLAVVLSLVALVWRASQGRMTELGLARSQLRFEQLGSTAETVPITGMLIFAPEESLFFANADTVRVQITNRLAASAEPVTSVLLDLELTNEIDVPSADMLQELHDDLEAAGVRLMLARVRPAVRDLLDRSGVTEAIGAENIHGRVLEGVVAHLSATGAHAGTFLGLSNDALRRMQRAVDEMLSQTTDERRAQLEDFVTRRYHEQVSPLNPAADLSQHRARRGCGVLPASHTGSARRVRPTPSRTSSGSGKR
jgi:sulfate permease, SulP family